MTSDTVEVPIRARFEPYPDIKTYDLALLLPYLLGQPLYRKNFWELPPNARRQLKLDEDWISE